MIVTGWKNGKFGTRQDVAVGLAIGRKNREQYFDKKWDHILIDFDGGTARVAIANRFWTSCPELRSRAIADWMKRNGLIPWPKGLPPRIKLIPIAQNKFQLSLQGANSGCSAAIAPHDDVPDGTQLT